MVTASTAEQIIKAMSRGSCVDRSEMDLHADTCVAGCNMVVLEDTGQTKLQVGLTCCLGTHDIKDSTHTVRYYALEDSVLR